MAPSAPPPPPPPGPTAEPDPPPPQAGGSEPSRPQRRLARPKDDRVVSGVAAGIANHFGVDPVWVRVLFVLGTFTAGIGLVLYVVLAFAMPQVEHSPAPGEVAPASQTVFWVGAGVALFLAGATVNVWPRGGLLVPIAIVAIGIALWQRPAKAKDSAVPAAPSGPGGTAQDVGPDGASDASSGGGATAGAAAGPVAGNSGSVVRTAAGVEGGVALAGSAPASEYAQAAPGAGTPASAATSPSPVDPVASEPVWWTPPAPRPRPSWLGPLTLGIAVVVAVVQAALDGLDVINVTPTQFFATGLLILGTGLVIGTLWGRAKWLVAPAVVLVAGLLIVETSVDLGIAISPNLRTGIYATSDVAKLPSGSVGDITLDLTEEPVPPTIAFEQGAGQLTVVVPWDADVDLTATVGVGQVEVYEVDAVEFATADGVSATEDTGQRQSWPQEWDRDTARIEGAITYSLERGISDMSFDVVDEANEVIGFGFVSTDARSVAAGVELSIESLEVASPWSNGDTPLELDLGMGAGAIRITRGAPPNNVLATMLEER